MTLTVDLVSRPICASVKQLLIAGLCVSHISGVAAGKGGRLTAIRNSTGEAVTTSLSEYAEIPPSQAAERLRWELQQYDGREDISQDECRAAGFLAAYTHNYSRDSVASQWNVSDIADRFLDRFGQRLERIRTSQLWDMVRWYMEPKPPYLGPTDSPRDLMIASVRGKMRDHRFQRKVLREIQARLQAGEK